MGEHTHETVRRIGKERGKKIRDEIIADVRSTTRWYGPGLLYRDKS
jgi:hypothetical protein